MCFGVFYDIHVYIYIIYNVSLFTKTFICAHLFVHKYPYRVKEILIYTNNVYTLVQVDVCIKHFSSLESKSLFLSEVEMQVDTTGPRRTPRFTWLPSYPELISAGTCPGLLGIFDHGKFMAFFCIKPVKFSLLELTALIDLLLQNAWLNLLGSCYC